MAAKSKKQYVYLDNNATTPLCEPVRALYASGKQYWNPSSSSHISDESRKVIDSARTYILRHCGISEETYKILFTSGATESNCAVIRMSVDAYAAASGQKPHIVATSVEHHSILECLHILELQGKAEYTLVPCNHEGFVTAESVHDAIKSNTCLVCVIHAGNETGAFNNLQLISKVTHEAKIPLHCDLVQSFGKIRIMFDKYLITSASASFHKLHGPQGIGLLILRNDFIEGYKLKALISGSQQYGLRGGTENVLGIAAALKAMVWTFKDRAAKNAHLNEMRELVITSLAKEWNMLSYEKFLALAKVTEPLPKVEYGDFVTTDQFHLRGKPNAPKPIFVVLGPTDIKRRLPSTLLISFVNPREIVAYGSDPEAKSFCNIKLKEKLGKMGFVVSITSACLTTSATASHVLTAIGAPKLIKKGVLRISFGDTNKISEVREFIKSLKAAVLEQI